MPALGDKSCILGQGTSSLALTGRGTGRVVTTLLVSPGLFRILSSDTGTSAPQTLMPQSCRGSMLPLCECGGLCFPDPVPGP